MPSRQLTLADGQLSTTTATLIGGADVPGSHVSVLLSNTSSFDVTVTLSFQRAGGTARRIRKVTLEADDQLLLRHLPIQPNDTLLGVANVPSAVDYLVNSSTDGPISISVLSASGGVKNEITGETAVTGQVNVGETPSMEDLMTEQNSILRRVLLALELLHGNEIPDPV